MDELSQSTAEETIHCENCGSTNPGLQKFCSACSFPINGSDEEKHKFKIKISGHKFLIAESQKEMKTARTIILVLAAFVLGIGLYQGLGQDNFAGMILNLFICLLYLILAASCNKNPFAAILSAFVIYITINVINAFFEPGTLFQGIFMKIFFIGAFIKGIRSAKDAQDHRLELGKLGVRPTEDE